MGTTSRRGVLAAGASAVGIAVAGCLDGGTDDGTVDESIPATAATLYKGPNCTCCDAYAAYLDEHVDATLETVVPADLAAVKADRGIGSDLRSCHTVELDDYLVEGHVPVELVAALFDEEPAIDGIALPGMPPGTPGMGGEKSGTWTVYEIRPGGERVVYAEL